MDKKLSKSTKGVIFTLLGGICWGFSGTCGQYLFTRKNIESGWLTMVRMITAGIVLITFLLVKREKGMREIWKNKRDVVNLLLFAIFGLLFCQYTYLTAIFYSNAGTATLFSFLWLHTPFTSIDILGFVFIMTTVFLLSKKPKREN